MTTFFSAYKKITIIIVFFVVLTATGSCKTATGEAGNDSSSNSGNTASTCTISAGDAPTGWANCIRTSDLAGNSVTPPDSTKGTTGGYGGTAVTVNSRSDLIKYAEKGNYIIYVNGIIDMSNGLLPDSAAGTTDALDSFIRANTAGSYATLAAWKSAYGSACSADADESGTLAEIRSRLSSTYGSTIKLIPASNTTIIGLTSKSGIKGGTIQISSVSNVVIRNLIIQDAFDPFPQHEKNDGFNANWDCIQIQSSRYIWIDHCTLQDTIASSDNDFDHVAVQATYGSSCTTGEKWQVFDGLCDIKKASDFITVSYCKFYNHDKTSLIGHSDSYTGDTNHQTITLHHNYYLNCRQRLPMVRFATIHIYNNYYETDSSSERSNSYAVGIRRNSRIVAENNYFGSGICYSFKDSYGTLYTSGNTDNSIKGCTSEISSSMPWTPANYYTYTLDSASDLNTSIPSNAGAGVWAVSR